MLRVGFVGSGLIAWAHGLSLKALIDGGVVEARGSSLSMSAANAAQCTASPRSSAATKSQWWPTPPRSPGAATPSRSALLRPQRIVARWTRRWPQAAPSFARSRSTWTCDREPPVEAVSASGVPSQSGLVLRSAPVFRELRDLLQGGTLGAPMAAVFRDDQYFPIQGTYASQWRADVSQAGGGCLIEHSIHDLASFAIASAMWESIVARTANHARHPGIEDLAAVTLSFVSGSRHSSRVSGTTS